MNKRNTMTGYYPDYEDQDFYRKINKKKEFYDSEIRNIDRDLYFLQPQQRFLFNYINSNTGYDKILVYHSVGVGKTMSAISIAYRNRANYNIIVVAKNRNIEENFKKQLDIFNKHVEDEGSLGDGKDWFNKIQYSTYRSMVSSGENSDWVKKPLVNTVLIFDEIHNALGNEIYKSIIKVLEEGINLKVVLLSATPVFDNVIEAFELCNILKQKYEPLVPTDESSLVNLGFIKKTNGIVFQGENTIGNSSRFNASSIYKLTVQGKKFINRTLKGKVSYLTVDQSLFPRRNYIGSPVIKNDRHSIKVINCIMSDFQEKKYIETISKKDDLFKKSSDALTIVYPDGETGTTGFAKNKKFFNTIFKSENIKKYSSKLHGLLINVKKSIGPVFVYSNFVNKGGIDLVKNLLLENGYSQYGGRGKEDKVLMFGENLSPESRQRLLKIFNSKENSGGKIIKVLLGGPSVSEGITFKNLEQIHILEPYWNMSRLEQVIGRGVRLGSHSALPYEKRYVNIFMYCTVSRNESTTTVDTFKYSLSSVKDRVIKDIESVLRETAVDCSLNKFRNKGNLEKFSDDSRECLYKTCDYKCDSGDLPKNNKKIDYSTYFINVNDPFRYSFLKKQLMKYISTTGVFKFGDINGFFSEKFGKKSHPEDIAFILNEVIQKETVYKNENGLDCILKKKGELFFSNPIGVYVNGPLFNKLFVEKYPLSSSTINSSGDKNTGKTKKQKKSGTGFVITKGVKQGSSKETTSKGPGNKVKISKKILKTKGIFGYFSEKDNSFKIIDNRTFGDKPSGSSHDPGKEDNRSNFRGKVCGSFKIEEILGMIKDLDLDVYEKIIKEREPGKRLQKQILCDTIQKILVKKSKII